MASDVGCGGEIRVPTAAIFTRRLEQLDYKQGGAQLGTMNDYREMAQRLEPLLRQRAVLREQAQLIAEALADIGDQIELLRAEANASGVVLGENAE
jgi:hypothetical protein